MMKESRFERIGLNLRNLGVDLSWIIDEAGSATARRVAQLVLGATNQGEILVLASAGFIGGTGLAAARHLASYGFTVRVLHNPNTEKGPTVFSEAYKSHNRALRQIKQYLQIKDWNDDGELFGHLEMLNRPVKGIVIALDETQWVIRDPQARNHLTTRLRLLNCPLICIADTDGRCIHDYDAHMEKLTSHTILMFNRLTNTNSRYSSDKVTEELGIPWEAEWILGPGDIRPELFDRPTTARKGDFGQVMVVGGSRGRGPAPVLAGLAAMHSGVDWVSLFVPEPVLFSMASYGPLLYSYPIRNEIITSEHLVLFKDQLSTSSLRVVLIGPGMSKHPETLSVIPQMIEIVQEKGFSLVLDADALKADILPILRSSIPTILTPNHQEFLKLFRLSPSESLQELADHAQQMASQYSVTILLKGPRDLIVDYDHCRFNDTGNPGMTVAGTGDVLSGIAAGLLAQFHRPFEAACWASYCSGASGDLAYRKAGNGLTAMDVIEQIRHVLFGLSSD